MTSPKFGIYASNRGPILFGTSVDEIYELASMADASELVDSFWVGDNILSTPRLDSISVLSGAATITKRVGLGVACMASFSIRHPMILAYQWASLDVLSKGRTVLIACIGGAPGQPSSDREFRAFGLDPHRRVAALEECVKIVRLLWGNDDVTYRGKFYSVLGATVLPKPVQSPLPIFIATRPGGIFAGPRIDFASPVAASAFRRVARLADGWATSYVTPEDFETAWNEISDDAAKEGRAVEQNILDYSMNLNPSREDATRETKLHFEKLYGRPFTGEQLELWTASGPRQHCIDHIERFLQAGVQRFVIKTTAASPKDQLKRWIDDVFPSF